MAMQKYILKLKPYIKALLGNWAALKLKEVGSIVKKIPSSIWCSIKLLGTIIRLTVSWVFLLVVYYFMAVTICFVWTFLLIIHYYLIEVPVYILKKIKQKTYSRIRKILDRRSIKTLIQHIKCHPATLRVSNYLNVLINTSKEKLSKINHLHKQFIKTIRKGLLGLRQLYMERLEQLCKIVSNVRIQLRKIWHITRQVILATIKIVGVIAFLIIVLLVIFLLYTPDMTIMERILWALFLLLSYSIIITKIKLKKIKADSIFGVKIASRYLIIDIIEHFRKSIFRAENYKRFITEDYSLVLPLAPLAIRNLILSASVYCSSPVINIYSDWGSEPVKDEKVQFIQCDSEECGILILNGDSLKQIAKNTDILLNLDKKLSTQIKVLSEIKTQIPPKGEYTSALSELNKKLSTQTGVLSEIKTQILPKGEYTSALSELNKKLSTQTGVLSEIKTQIPPKGEYTSALSELDKKLSTQTGVLSEIKTQIPPKGEYTSALSELDQKLSTHLKNGHGHTVDNRTKGEYTSALSELNKKLSTQTGVLSEIKTQIPPKGEYTSALSELDQKLSTHLKNGHGHTVDNHTIGELIHRHRLLISNDSILLQNGQINTMTISILEKKAIPMCDGNYFMVAAHKIFHKSLVVPGEDKLDKHQLQKCKKNIYRVLECVKSLKLDNNKQGYLNAIDTCIP